MCGWVVLKGSPSYVFNHHIKAGPSRTLTLDFYESQYNNQPLRKVTHGLPSVSPSTLVPTSGKTMISVQQVGHGKGYSHWESLGPHRRPQREGDRCQSLLPEPPGQVGVATWIQPEHKPYSVAKGGGIFKR